VDLGLNLSGGGTSDALRIDKGRASSLQVPWQLGSKLFLASLVSCSSQAPGLLIEKARLPDNQRRGYQRNTADDR
jgi:hypothetical protein